jgi:hypothetical protein
MAFNPDAADPTSSHVPVPSPPDKHLYHDPTDGSHEEQAIGILITNINNNIPIAMEI